MNEGDLFQVFPFYTKGPENTESSGVLLTVDYCSSLKFTQFLRSKQSQSWGKKKKKIRLHLYRNITSYVTADPWTNWSFLHSISLSHCGSRLIRHAFGTSLSSSSCCSITVFASWSNPVLHHMNHTFPLLPIFTAAMHLDLFKRFTPQWLRKTRNPGCSRLRFSHSLCFLTVSA